MRSSFQNFSPFLFTLILLSLSSCTGSVTQPSGPSGDANGIQGYHERAYYSVLNSNQANVVLTQGKGYAARLLALSSRTILSEESIPADSISFSIDEAILEIKGRSELFERSSSSIDSILASQNQLIPARVDTYCKGLKGGYPELLIEASGTFEIYGITMTSKDVIGGRGSVEKVGSQSSVVYRKTGFGELTIDKTLPHSNQPYFFKTTFSPETGSPWTGENEVYCHLNSNPVTAYQGNTLVSSMAMSSNVLPLGNGGFTDHSQARNPDGASSTWNDTELSSDILSLTGYFTEPGSILPLNATIDGVKVNCNWFGNDFSNDIEITLRKHGLPIGTSKRKFNTLSSTPAMSQDFGGTGDLWGYNLTPADINAADFGLQLQAYVTFGENGGFAVDYCTMNVYWH